MPHCPRRATARCVRGWPPTGRPTERPTRTGSTRPVPSFGPLDARLLMVGLAPGVRGANRTGRPFTGDHAGMLLYQTLLRFGLAQGNYGADAGRRPDAAGLPHRQRRALRAAGQSARAGRRSPPATASWPARSRRMPRLRGGAGARRGRTRRGAARVRHDAAARSAFSHGAIHALPDGLLLADSYHVSR